MPLAQRPALASLVTCWLVAAGCAAPPAASPEAGAPGEPGGPGGAGAEWRWFGGDAGGARYSPLSRIDRDNVGRLSRAWTYRTGEVSLHGQAVEMHENRRPPPFETTPLVVDGVLYLSTPSSRVIALDAETGRELWVFDPFQGREGERSFAAHRGVAYWQGTASAGTKMDRRILVGTRDGRLVALDAATGRPVAAFGQNGSVDLREGVTGVPGDYAMSSPPAVYRDLVITGAVVPEGAPRGPSGDVRAFDVRTGRLVWRFHTVPRPGEPGHESWEGDSWRDRTGVNVWSIMSVDAERGMVFLPTGSAASDFYGGDREGQNLYANSLVALDAATGKLRWYRQLVHHDIWDYDLPAQPALVTIRRAGKDVPAVVQVTKSGLMFVFDRRTGEPLFPIEERPVPPSNTPGEAAWPTQPFPVRPAPLSRHHAFTRTDLTDVTPDSRASCSAIFDQVKRSVGVYTPADTVLTLWFPGTLGGATWSGVSFDPATGRVFVNVNNIGALGAMRPRAGAGPDGVAYERRSPWGGYARFWDENDLPCQKPPWGQLHAIDLATGEYEWTVPLGVSDRLLARGISGTGAPNIGGSVATAGGLVFIASTNDRRFRAFDTRTGAQLWEARLEASGHASPITYLGKRSGKQFVVVAAGGGGFFNRDAADALVAFALPD